MYLKTHIITSFLIIKEIKGREKREGKNLKHNLFLFLFTYQISVYDRNIHNRIDRATMLIDIPKFIVKVPRIHNNN